jgi:branched-chain amino acid transport system permease protein
MMNLRLAAFGKLRQIIGSYLALGGAALTALVGVAAMIEMLYHLQLNQALGPKMPFMGATLDTHGVDSWFGAGLLVVVGVALFELARRSFTRQWGTIQEEIEKEIKRREAL